MDAAAAEAYKKAYKELFESASSLMPRLDQIKEQAAGGATSARTSKPQLRPRTGGGNNRENEMPSNTASKAPAAGGVKAAPAQPAAAGGRYMLRPKSSRGMPAAAMAEKPPQRPATARGEVNQARWR